MNLLIRIAGCAAVVALFLPGVHFPDLVRYLMVSLLLLLSAPLRCRLNMLFSRTQAFIQLGLRSVTFGLWLGLLLIFHRASLLYPPWALALFVLCLAVIMPWLTGWRQKRCERRLPTPCLIEPSGPDSSSLQNAVTESWQIV